MPKYNSSTKKSSPKPVPGLSPALLKRLEGWHIGVDEAGRGCLAGPVTAAAVIVRPGFDFSAAASLSGLTDSKQISAEKRDALALAIRSSGLFWGIGQSWPSEIDSINILNATFRAMSRAVMSAMRAALGREPALASMEYAALPLLIDGPHAIPLPQWVAARKNLLFEAPPRQFPVVKGDLLVPAISAASILAKTHRDKLMCALDRRYPEYSFAGHKGYGTREHMQKLDDFGLCRQHRASFGKKREEKQLSLI